MRNYKTTNSLKSIEEEEEPSKVEFRESFLLLLRCFILCILLSVSFLLLLSLLSRLVIKYVNVSSSSICCHLNSPQCMDNKYEEVTVEWRIDFHSNNCD